MNKILCTFGWGQASEWLDITRGPMINYAARHGYRFLELETKPSYPAGTKYGKDDSWCKIPLIIDMLSCNNYVLWLDADVLVKDGCTDILSDCPGDEFNMALVKHHSNPYGWHPNRGVWLLQNTQTTQDVLKKIHEMPTNENPMVHKMWEQGALLTLMGVTQTNPANAYPVKLPSEYRFYWHELPMKWNCSSSDLREWPIDAAFLHASTYTNQKASLLKTWKWFLTTKHI